MVDLEANAEDVVAAEELEANAVAEDVAVDVEAVVDGMFFTIYYFCWGG